MNRLFSRIAIAALAALSALHAGDGGKSGVNVLRRPLSKVEALNIALTENGIIRQAQKDVEAAAGIAIQVRAILFPKVINTAGYQARQDYLVEQSFTDIPAIAALRLPGITERTVNNQSWSADIQIVQSIYEGGRMRSAVRSSKLIREQALLAFQGTVADTLLAVSTSYDDVLSTAKQIEVREASVKLLGEYLEVARTKAKAGAVTEFDVLRQEVEVANAEAALVQAVGDHRVAKQVLVEQLGQNLPTTVSDNLPLNLTTPLEARAYPRKLSEALAEALGSRTEIAALEKEVLLRDEGIVRAKSGIKPSVQAFAGYQMMSQVQSRNAGDGLAGGLVGVQLSWPIFDGFLTKGRIDEAVAQRGKAGEAKAETTRIVELQVRTAWSDLRAARAVLDAEEKNIDKAVKALSLVDARYNEGAATQVEVLSAQTALTDARTAFVQGLRNYSVARSRLIRATGENIQRTGTTGK